MNLVWISGISVLLTGALALPGPPNSRIVNGVDSEVGQWPWQISLHYKGSNGFSHICGGSLIDSNWVLTAAHCVEFDTVTSNFRVVLGKHKQTVVGEQEETVDVERIILHENYNQGSGIPNDIALLKLSKAASTSNAHISLVSLPSSDSESFLNEECYISGWGKTSSTSGIADTLQHVRINVMGNSQCQWQWLFQSILSTHICVGGGSESACNGDSGGPLVCLKNNEYVLAGVTSWGSSNCQNMPNVYTRVSKFLSWIRNNQQ